jgi:hypothetical protein
VGTDLETQVSIEEYPQESNGKGELKAKPKKQVTTKSRIRTKYRRYRLQDHLALRMILLHVHTYARLQRARTLPTYLTILSPTAVPVARSFSSVSSMVLIRRPRLTVQLDFFLPHPLFLLRLTFGLRGPRHAALGTPLGILLNFLGLR